MDRVVEEIASVPEVAQNQDDKVHHIFIRQFNSNNYLKQFILWIVLFICLILIAGPLALHISSVLPTVKTRNIPLHLFSEERARDYFSNLTLYGSRVSNTRGDFYTRRFLITQIERICSISKRHLQFEFDLQNFTDLQHNQLQNIIVRLSNLTTKSKNVSMEFSPGGSDDGSGIVILLELLSNLVNDLTLTFSDVHLIILFTSAEEINSQGAKEFITNHIWRSNIRYFINIDAASCNEKASLNRIIPSQLIVDYSRVLRPRANVITEYIHKWFKWMSDYDAFIVNNSLLGYEFGFLLDGYIYHTSLDHPSMIKQGVLQDLGENLGILIRHILLGNINLQVTRNIIDKDPFIYFDILSRYLIVYRMSTSIIIQLILIILVLVIGITLILFDHIWHRKRTLTCMNFHCIYLHFKYPLIIRIISIIIYFISNIFSVSVGLLFAIIVALIMATFQPLSWFGNATLAIFLFSLPCLIGMITIGYLWTIFHRFILRKWPKNSFRFDSTIEEQHLNKASFDFEHNLAVLFIYSLLMIVSIYFSHRLSYLILAEILSNNSVIVQLISQSSSITVATYDGLALSSVLNDFSAKSGHILHNQRCLRRTTKCTFDDTFNRTIAVQHIKIKSMNNFSDYIIIVQHVLSYNIQVSSFSLTKFLVLNRSNIPRTETIIYVTLNSLSSSFDINIRIRRCDLIDSPFLLLFTRMMSNMVLMGMSQCQAIDDDTILTIKK
ncbi:unnamed protein product [Rotaria sordida]|uniref:Vacuolar membrane protease n=1 Tax=Rotaria sordida TaxID=392033 RepID=A0A813WFH0_9BILA|nr:unnamed protein product [Rotaria sordida]CAF3785958.1 unnamed protein product [Rotaria sordida]